MRLGEVSESTKADEVPADRALATRTDSTKATTAGARAGGSERATAATAGGKRGREEQPPANAAKWQRGRDGAPVKQQQQQRPAAEIDDDSESRTKAVLKVCRPPPSEEKAHGLWLTAPPWSDCLCHRPRRQWRPAARSRPCPSRGGGASRSAYSWPKPPA